MRVNSFIILSERKDEREVEEEAYAKKTKEEKKDESMSNCCVYESM